MNTSVLQEPNLEQKISELKNQLIEGKPKYEDFLKTYYSLRKMYKEFQDLLQWAAEDHREKEKEYQRLYHQVAGWNASDMIENLKKIGLALKKSQPIKDAFDRQGYRILELARSGKREEVFHAMMRIFMAAKKEFPERLVEAFKPAYTEDLFKIFIFSFLSGILGNEGYEKEG